MKRVVPVLIAVLIGLFVLAGYVLQSLLAPVLIMFLNWGVLLVGVALLVGMGHLLVFHFSRLINDQEKPFYSLIVLSAFTLTLVGGLVLSLQDVFFRNLVLNILIPIEAGLLAILAITLVYMSLYLIRTRGWTVMSVSFLVSAIISLLLNLGYVPTQPGTRIGELVAFLRRLPIVGVRGILLGIALGGLLVGLRVILAIDRPYGDEP